MTATIDPAVLVEAAPAPSVVETVVSDRRDPARSSRRRRVAGRVEADVPPGTLVRTRRGAALVGVDGGFLVAAEPGDDLVVDAVPARRAVVPPSGPVNPTTTS